MRIIEDDRGAAKAISNPIRDALDPTRGAPRRTPTWGGIAPIPLGLLPMTFAFVVCLLVKPSEAALVAALLFARFRLERIRIESERDVAVARIRADSGVAIARLVHAPRGRRPA